MLLLTITLETGISLNIYIYSIFALIMVIGRSMVDNDGLVVARKHLCVFFMVLHPAIVVLVLNIFYLTGTQVSSIIFILHGP